MFIKKHFSKYLTCSNFSPAFLVLKNMYKKYYLVGQQGILPRDRRAWHATRLRPRERPRVRRRQRARGQPHLRA